MGRLTSKSAGAAASRGWPAQVIVARLALILLLLVPGLSAAELPLAEDERAKNEEAALSMWPEAGDPQSIMGREMQRLLDHYGSRNDPRLKQVTAPMWIASQAAANTERQRTEAESQQSAMRLYPDLSVLDTPLNRLFRDTFARYKEVKPDYFSDPRWPIKLAQQCALQLDAQRAIGSLPSNTPGASDAVAANAVIPDVDPETPAEIPPRPIRKWILNGLLILCGTVLVVVIFRRALRARKARPDEQDGSAI